MIRHRIPARVGPPFQGGQGSLKGCPYIWMVAAAIAGGLAIHVAAQSSELQLTILSPGDGAYVSGPTLLKLLSCRLRET